METTDSSTRSLPEPVRDPMGPPDAVADARRRPMAERLELALSWNKVASELRAGLSRAKRDSPTGP